MLSSTDRLFCSIRTPVVRQGRFPKLGSKPDWLNVQSLILPLSHEENSASEGNLNAYVSHLFCLHIYPLNGYRELNSFEEPWFMLVATVTSFAREVNPTGVGEHIYYHPRQTDCFVRSEPLQGRSKWWELLESKYHNFETPLKPSNVCYFCFFDILIFLVSFY